MIMTVMMNFFIALPLQNNKIIYFFRYVYFPLKYNLLSCPTSLSLHDWALHDHHKLLYITKIISLYATRTITYHLYVMLLITI
jgi:hypothetical protein